MQVERHTTQLAAEDFSVQNDGVYATDVAGDVTPGGRPCRICCPAGAHVDQPRSRALRTRRLTVRPRGRARSATSLRIRTVTVPGRLHHRRAGQRRRDGHHHADERSVSRTSTRNDHGAGAERHPPRCHFRRRFGTNPAIPPVGGLARKLTMAILELHDPQVLPRRFLGRPHTRPEAASTSPSEAGRGVRLPRPQRRRASRPP